MGGVCPVGSVVADHLVIARGYGWGEPGVGEQGPAGRDQRLPREASVRRLMGLDGEGRLTTGHVQLAAEGLGVSERA